MIVLLVSIACVQASRPRQHEVIRSEKPHGPVESIPTSDERSHYLQNHVYHRSDTGKWWLGVEARPFSSVAELSAWTQKGLPKGFAKQLKAAAKKNIPKTKKAEDKPEDRGGKNEEDVMQTDDGSTDGGTAAEVKKDVKVETPKKKVTLKEEADPVEDAAPKKKTNPKKETKMEKAILKEEADPVEDAAPKKKTNPKKETKMDAEGLDGEGEGEGADLVPKKKIPKKEVAKPPESNAKPNLEGEEANMAQVAKDSKDSKCKADDPQDCIDAKLQCLSTIHKCDNCQGDKELVDIYFVKPPFWKQAGDKSCEMPKVCSEYSKYSGDNNHALYTMVCCEKNRADCDMPNPIVILNIILGLLGIFCCLPIGIWCFCCRTHTENALSGLSGRDADGRKKAATQKMKNVFGATQSMKKEVEAHQKVEGGEDTAAAASASADADAT